MHRHGLTVANPPGFAGFPAHDRSDPAFAPATHGLDPAAYFTHWEAAEPLIVAHATGRPAYRVAGGRAVPIA